MRIIQKYIVLRLLASVISGILWMLCFEPYGFAVAGFVAFIPWFFVLKKMHGYEVVISSLFVSGFLTFGNLGWISHLHIGGFAAVVAYFWLGTMFFGFITRFALKKNFAYTSLVVVSAFISLEVIRSYINLPLTFPWLKLGYSQSNFMIFAQIADIGGAYFVSGVLIFINLTLSVFLIDISPGFQLKHTMKPLVALILFIFVLGYGFIRVYQVESQKIEGPKIALVQPNRFFPGGDSSSYKRMNLFVMDAVSKADIIAIPETMLHSETARYENGKLILDSYGKYWLNNMLNSNENIRVKYFIGGISLTSEEKNKYLNDVPYRRNSSILINTNGKILDDYSKIGIVPIGEYVPYLSLASNSMKIIAPILLLISVILISLKLIFSKKCRSILNKRARVIIWIFLIAFVYVSVILTSSAYLKDIMIAGFASAGLGEEYIPNDKPGEKYTKFLTKITVKEIEKEYKFSTPICYELGYPDILRKLSHSDGENIDFMLNLSNDNFYKKSAELDQMLNIARFRCIENRKSMGRCTTTGISAFVSATGEIQEFVQEYDEIKEVPGLLIRNIDVHKGRSLYNILGDWFAWLCFASLSLILLLLIYNVKDKQKLST